MEHKHWTLPTGELPFMQTFLYGSVYWDYLISSSPLSFQMKAENIKSLLLILATET